jgi:hypothetical protein
MKQPEPVVCVELVGLVESEVLSIRNFLLLKSDPMLKIYQLSITNKET